MESLQRELAATATFADDHGIDPAVVAIDEPADLTDGLPDARQETLPGTHPNTGDPDAPVVVGSIRRS